MVDELGNKQSDYEQVTISFSNCTDSIKVHDNTSMYMYDRIVCAILVKLLQDPIYIKQCVHTRKYQHLSFAWIQEIISVFSLVCSSAKITFKC